MWFNIVEHRFRKPTVKVLYGLNFILVHLRLQSDKINKDNRVEIPEAWMRATEKTQQHSLWQGANAQNVSLSLKLFTMANLRW